VEEVVGWSVTEPSIWPDEGVTGVGVAVEIVLFGKANAVLVVSGAGSPQTTPNTAPNKIRLVTTYRPIFKITTLP